MAAVIKESEITWLEPVRISFGFTGLSERHAKAIMRDIIRDGWPETRRPRQCVYVIRLTGVVAVDYPRGFSPVVYIGEPSSQESVPATRPHARRPPLRSGSKRPPTRRHRGACVIPRDRRLSRRSHDSGMGRVLPASPTSPALLVPSPPRTTACRGCRARNQRPEEVNMVARTPSSYERTEISAIHEWKNPKLTWLDSAMKVVNAPFNVAGELAMQVPGVEFVIEKALGGGLSLLTDGAALTVRTDSILQEFRPPLKTLHEIHELELASVDRAIGYLAAKYKSLALLEGAAAGGVGTLGPAAGAAAIAADVSALLALNLRAVGEYATYCGFDIDHQEERLFALNVLGLASAPTDAAKSVAMAQLVKISADVARRKTWAELERHAFVRIVQQIATALSIRLTKAKLAQLVPAAGAAIGGGFNAYFTSKVCDAAFYLYRERFLARKYGPDVIEITVAPAAPDDHGSGYEAS